MPHLISCYGGKVVRTVFIIVILVNMSVALAAQPSTSPEQRAGQYMESVRRQPSLLLAFLREMPKGGDLHNHLGGAIYAENLIDFAARDGLCVDRPTSSLVSAPCDASCDKSAARPAAACSYHDQTLYNALVDAWSMRNWERGHESGHDHFFASFDKFYVAMSNHMGESIALAARQAAADHLQYVELMHTADGMQSAQLGMKLGWNQNFAEMRDQLLSGGLKDVAAATRKKLDDDETGMRETLRCGTPQADPGCELTVRYLYQVLRDLPPEAVFAQILLGFELASADPRFVGLNLVTPEDWYVPMRDFDLHMKMLDYLHSIYPKVHLSLHAGELSLGLVAPEAITFHIRESVEVGHAERIGHGVDVMNEHDPLGLLQEMAKRGILVEICLTSEDTILGARGDNHPFPIYRRYHVPHALATDDEGVSRSDLTHEYLRAVESYHLSYADLKGMARQSLEHSFLPGASLWTDAQQIHAVAACEGDRTREAKPELSLACHSFLAANERARIQRKLEKEFAEFETKF
jgi:adenosine deaminase